MPTWCQFGKYVACEPVPTLLVLGLWYGFGGPLKGNSIPFAIVSSVNLKWESRTPENIRGHKTTMVYMQSIRGKINNKILDIMLGGLDLKTLRLYLCMFAWHFGIGFVVGFRCTRDKLGDDHKANHFLRKIARQWSLENLDLFPWLLFTAVLNIIINFLVANWESLTSRHGMDALFNQ